MTPFRQNAPQQSGLPLGFAPRVATIDRLMAFVIFLLLCGGSLAVYSASSHFGVAEAGSAAAYFAKHLQKIFLGLVAFFIMMKVDYRRLRPVAYWVGLASVAVLGVTLLMPPVNGARRWIIVGSHNFQPVDLAKFGLVLSLAAGLSRVRNFTQDWRAMLA
jgi:cell division protein FtsW